MEGVGIDILNDNDSQYLGVLRDRLDVVTQRSALIRRELEKLKTDLDRLDAERGYLEALLGLTQEAANDNRVLRLSAVFADADKVVELLREVGRPLHFREIAKMLQDRGVVLPGGVDPANTLLAKYFNDPRLFRPSRGTYALRAEGDGRRSVGQHRSAKEAR